MPSPFANSAKVTKQMSQAMYLCCSYMYKTRIEILRQGISNIISS